MRRIVKKYLPTALSLAMMMVVMLVPSMAFGAEHPVGGHKHVDVDVYHVPGDEGMHAQALFAEKWIPWEKSWYKDKIQVKDQGYSNVCWACSAASTAEISYAKETDSAVYDALSPYQIAYFFYNREDDPLGNTGGDKNNPRFTNDWNLEGGSCIYTFQHLATRSGMIPDQLAPLSDLVEYYKDDPARTPPAPGLSPDLAYDKNSLTMENCEYHPDLLDYNCLVDPDSSDLKKAKNTVKRMISEHGAVVVSIQVDSDHSTPEMDEGYFKDGDSTNAPFYKPDMFERNDHEVALVGWDDTYSKENFGSWNNETQEYDAKPKYDGAWIMQNSWGTDNGENGFYYISYESNDVLMDGILSMDMEPAGTSKYLYQYDGNAYAGPVTMFQEEKAANVFQAPENQQILVDRVGFTEYNEGSTDYAVDIYTGLEDPDDPLSGCKAMPSQMVSTHTPGYKTFKLNTPVTVDPGESWAVVITFRGTTYFGVEATSVYGDFQAQLAADQSFYQDTDSPIWIDAATENEGLEFCFRIKSDASDSPYASCAHDYALTDQVFQPTKNEAGYTVYRCTQCGHVTKDDIVPMLDPVPDETEITSLKASKKAFTVKWKKDPEFIRDKQITGYQVRYSLKSNMKKAKTVTVKGWSRTSKKVTKLKGGKKYYVQVRTCFKQGGKTYCSNWSAKRSIKVKK